MSGGDDKRSPCAESAAPAAADNVSEARHLRALSLGAGVQSTTVLLMSLAGEIEPFDVAIFADTQAEPAEVYSHLDKLTAEAERHGLPVVRVTAGSLTERMLDPTRRDGIQIPAFIVRDGEKAGLLAASKLRTGRTSKPAGVWQFEGRRNDHGGSDLYALHVAAEAAS